MFDVNDFEGFVNSLDLQNLQLCQQLINQALNSKFVQKSPNASPVRDIPNISDLVHYQTGYVDQTDRALISAELETLDFKLRSQSNAVQNKFLSSFADPYVWTSGKRNVVNNPLDLAKFPVIKSLMDKINQNFGCNMNSVLVSCYARGTVNVRLHDDNEATIDPAEPICVVSFGVKRMIEFVANNKLYKYKADLVLEPEDSSVYIMKPGCQEDYKHRVRRNKHIKDHRISLSFRCFVPPSKQWPFIILGSSSW